MNPELLPKLGTKGGAQKTEPDIEPKTGTNSRVQWISKLLQKLTPEFESHSRHQFVSSILNVKRTELQRGKCLQVDRIC